jgi:hypothetical protein
LRSSFESGVNITFEPGVFHTYELRSFDMRAYEFLIDNTVVRNGVFAEVITASEVSWGDSWQGSASLARWDYFEFGVVPEPQGIVALGLFCVLFSASRRLGL